MNSKLILTAMLAGGFVEAGDVTKLPPDAAKTELVRRMIRAEKLDLEVTVTNDPDTTFCGYANTIAGRHYIAINPRCSGAPVKNGRFDPYAVALLGHELGHIAHGDTAGGDKDDAALKREQIRADEFSGKVVAKMNGRLRDALALAVTMPETASGPRDRSKSESVDAFAKGWEEGRQEMGIRAQSWESESNNGPFHVCWQSFWMGCAATFFVIILFKR